jgi:hypothetical protein
MIIFVDVTFTTKYYRMISKYHFLDFAACFRDAKCSYRVRLRKTSIKSIHIIKNDFHEFTQIVNDIY